MQPYLVEMASAISQTLSQWPEIRSAIEKQRCELVLKEIKPGRSPQISADALQAAVFAEGNPLNYVTIQSCGLTTLHASIARCVHLTTLVLQKNALTQLPEELGSLPLLKTVDFSFNALRCLPKALANLAALELLDASHNEISDDGLPNFAKIERLHVLNLARNKLTVVPASLQNETLSKLHTLNLSGNAIGVIDEQMEHLASQLKNIDLSKNEIKPLPTVFAAFEHVKGLNLSENPFDDKRFRKMTNDSRMKVNSILEYLRKHWEPKSAKAEGAAEAPAENQPESTLVVTFGRPEASVKRIASVAPIRPSLVCCILSNLDLAGENFRKFINTKLHASLCDQRVAAAIGTHALGSFELPLRYLALPPDELFITALHKKTPISAPELINALMIDADLARKRQKRSTLNPLHRYITLVKDLALLPCLIDANGLVMSLAPITNSDVTKLRETTTHVLVEVSSQGSVELCKQVAQLHRLESNSQVMDALVRETLEICPDLGIEQIRVSGDDNLLAVYPDRSDLKDLELPIRRVAYSASSEA